LFPSDYVIEQLAQSNKRIHTLFFFFFSGGVSGGCFLLPAGSVMLGTYDRCREAKGLEMEYPGVGSDDSCSLIIIKPFIGGFEARRTPYPSCSISSMD
jgi:hypothetical protein